ncbi:MAG: hypothetical protein QXV73_05340 [Candidatus Micrarchaeia archaeon]
MDEKKFDEAIQKIAREINRKRQEEVLTFFNKRTWFSDYIKKVKMLGIYDKPSKSKVWRKIAEMPPEVDHFFTRIYGSDYFKDKNFFTKIHTEWRVTDKI